ncbi:DUF916 and DUF3324 domain-containing protein [Aerococcus sp. NPDC058936]|uniref:DUF916 and DUF3324 domain-containing protein n=1 Tax=Aerococcus sp. NPDC058936 TaxID=3346674 RepID=UPI00366FAF4D
MYYKNKVFFGLTVLIFLAFFFIIQPVQATENEAIGYSVAPVIPANQLGDTTSYFDLRIEPNQEQTIQVELSNGSTEDKTVSAQLANATTNVNGLIVYEADTNDNIDPSLTAPLTEWTSLSSNEVIIPAGQSTTLDITMNVPEEAFDGVKLGGIIFQEVTEEGTGDASGEQGVAVRNAYTYIIALQVSENDNEVPIDFAIGKVSPELANGARTVVAQIQHPQARLTGGVSIQADIFEQNGESLIASKTMEDVSFAPNSTMPFTLEWDHALKAGDYRIDMVLTRDGQEWDFTKEFTIQPEEEAEINEAAVTEVVDDSVSLPTWIIIVAILVVIVIIALVAYVLHLKRKLK